MSSESSSAAQGEQLPPDFVQGIMLDRVRELVLPATSIPRYESQLMQINIMRFGLDWIFNQVVELESHMVKTRYPLIDMDSRGTDVAGLVAGEPLSVATCMFQWYSVTATNLAQMTGWILCDANLMTQKCSDYVSEVLPQVRIFRNKIGAHLAGATANTRDSDSERSQSVMESIGIFHGRLTAIPSTPLAKGVDGRLSVDTALKPWILVNEHMELRSRYWPEPTLVAPRAGMLSLNSRSAMRSSPPLNQKYIDASDLPGSPAVPNPTWSKEFADMERQCRLGRFDAGPQGQFPEPPTSNSLAGEMSPPQDALLKKADAN